MQAARERARVGMAAGEEKYLPVRDKGPQKRYVRDYIDARFSLGEVLLPLLVLVIVSYFFEAIAAYVLIAVWAAIIVVVAEGIIVGILLRRKLAAKFGADKRRARRALVRVHAHDPDARAAPAEAAGQARPVSRLTPVICGPRCRAARGRPPAAS